MVERTLDWKKDWDLESGLCCLVLFCEMIFWENRVTIELTVKIGQFVIKKKHIDN